VERTIGGLPIREIRMLPYPHFPDLRGASLDGAHPITASLEQLTLNWASPIEVDAEANAPRTVTELLRSSPESWRSPSLELVPDYQAWPDAGFPVEGERGRSVLAVAVEGRFDSYFADRGSPLAETPDAPEDAEADDADAAEEADDGAPQVTSVVDRSPESARLVVVASSTFATDTALDLASQGLGTFYLQPVTFLQNVIDWSLEDRSLLALRGRSQLARTLEPMEPGAQRRWEYVNYALAIAGLVGVWAWRRRVAAADRRRYQRILAEV
jgi:ABC-2 type transport system permease protein